MSYLVDHWSYDPFLIVALVLAGWRQIGLWRLARRSRPDRTRQRRVRSIWFYAGLAVMLIAVESPIDYWSDDYFFVHMIQHLLLMFAGATLVVAGAPPRSNDARGQRSEETSRASRRQRRIEYDPAFDHRIHGFVFLPELETESSTMHRVAKAVPLSGPSPYTSALPPCLDRAFR